MSANYPRSAWSSSIKVLRADYALVAEGSASECLPNLRLKWKFCSKSKHQKRYYVCKIWKLLTLTIIYDPNFKVARLSLKLSKIEFNYIWTIRYILYELWFEYQIYHSLFYNTTHNDKLYVHNKICHWVHNPKIHKWICMLIEFHLTNLLKAANVTSARKYRNSNNALKLICLFDLKYVLSYDFQKLAKKHTK